MDYREFTCAVEKQMNQKMTGGVKAGLYTAEKNNGTERTGILIEIPGVNISPTIYLEEYYESYLAGESIETVVGDIINFYKNIRQEKSWDCSRVLDYENVREHIVFKMINTSKNRNFLSTVPHITFLDLSIVFYVLLEAAGEGTAAMVINEDHAGRWKVGKDALWREALRNIKKLLPAEFFTMNYALREMLKKNTESESAPEHENLLDGNMDASDSMYILSNNLRNYGAACIAYPHILEMIGNILQTDFYVLPSSVHEVVITPCQQEISCSELDEMVRDINRTQVAEEEILSDHAYLYERRTGRLRIGAERRAGREAG